MIAKRLIAFGLPIIGAAISGTLAVAQEQGDIKRGEKLAIETCAVCHGIRSGEKSANATAPTFAAIAAVRGMSTTALNVALSTAHRTMPNFMLEAGERADVAAYIMSLKANQPISPLQRGG